MVIQLGSESTVLNIVQGDKLLLQRTVPYGTNPVVNVVAEERGVDGTTAEYYHSMNWELPNSYIAHSWVGDPLDLGEKIMEFNDGARKSLALGFTFDNSDLITEYTALQNVYDEYAKALLYGFVDPDDPEKGIAAFNDALYAVGLQKYMDAKAEALAEWAEANGK